jgi:hypothetical protein
LIPLLECARDKTNSLIGYASSLVGWCYTGCISQCIYHKTMSTYRSLMFTDLFCRFNPLGLIGLQSKCTSAIEARLLTAFMEDFMHTPTRIYKTIGSIVQPVPCNPIADRTLTLLDIQFQKGFQEGDKFSTRTPHRGYCSPKQPCEYPPAA